MALPETGESLVHAKAPSFQLHQARYLPLVSAPVSARESSLGARLDSSAVFPEALPDFASV